MQQLAAESALHLEDLLDRVVPLLVAAEPDGFFDESGAADLREATSAGLRSLLAVLGGERADDHLAVAAGAGRRQIQQALPLEGVLRAYRLAGQAVWEHFVVQARKGPADVGDALLDGASEVWRVIDLFSSAAGEAYRKEQAVLRTRDRRVQTSLLAALLAGQGSDPAFAKDAGRALGLDASGGFACVVALAVTGASEGREVPEDALRVRGVLSIWLSRPGGEVGLVSLSKTGPSRLLELLDEAARGRVGVSPAFTDLADLPRAERLADVAARLPGAGRGARTVSSDLLAALVVDSPIIADLIAEDTVDALLEAAKGDGPAMMETVRAYLAADGQLAEAAARAFLHRNTLLYRLNKVERLTGLSLRTPRGQQLWRIGLLARDIEP